MPRQGRINIEGGIYHVIQRGIERKAIFKDDADRKDFVRRLSEGLEETGHKCYGWVLMPNHFHLIIRTGVKPLSDLMRKLLTGYALYFNKRYRRNGYLYQGRYKSILCQEEEYLLELLRYIHLNPLRAKIVKDMEGLSNYKWSGYSVMLNKTQAKWQSTGEILEYFGKRKSEAIKKYETFVSEAKDIGKRDDLTGGGLIRSAGGWREVLNMRRSREKWLADERILGDGEFVEKVLKFAEEKFIRQEKMKRDGWDIQKLRKHVSDLIGIEEDYIMGKRKKSKTVQAKALIAYWGTQELGISGVEMSRYFGITKQAIAYLAKKGEILANKNNYYLSI